MYLFALFFVKNPSPIDDIDNSINDTSKKMINGIVVQSLESRKATEILDKVYTKFSSYTFYAFSYHSLEFKQGIWIPSCKCVSFVPEKTKILKRLVQSMI